MTQSSLPVCPSSIEVLRNNCYGTITWDDGDKYVGEIKDGKYNGQGTYTYANGNEYVGEHKDGKSNGRGITFRSDGTIKESGIYENGVLIRSEVIDTAVFTRLYLDINTQTAAAQQQAQVKPQTQIAPQGKRVALVIGNAKYKFSPLNNPVNDATDMAASLRSVGFDVIEIRDANKRQMRAATRRFEDKLAASDVGLVYYSGHGVEVKGRNYLIPVDADIRREHEVEDQAFDAGNILRMMESLQGTEKKRVNIMIVDA
jgi:hypothetical protein